MATELTPDQTAQFSRLIDAVLESSDLDTISAKKVRKAIQAAVTYDVNPYKDAINNLIHTRFELIAPKPEPPSEPQPHITTSAPPAPNQITASLPSAPPNGKTITTLKRSASPHTDDVSSLPPQSSPPPAKKHKKNVSNLDADALFAAKLQAEEDKSRSRTTRNVANGTERKTKKPAGKKAKSKARVTSDDDTSNVEAAEKKVNRTGGFHKPMGLQPPLADLLGVQQLSRPQTVKQLWVYIKAKNLQDPEDKRVILCDEGLRRVFNKDKLQMFSMNKQLSTLLYALDE